MKMISMCQVELFLKRKKITNGLYNVAPVLYMLIRTRLAYRICKVQTAASAVGCGWIWSEKLNNRKSDGGMTGDVCYRICTIDRS